MEIEISPELLESSLEKLDLVREKANVAYSFAGQKVIDESYSRIPGFDVLGSNHGTLQTGGAGSGSEVLRSFGEQIGWIAEMLRANIQAFSGQEVYSRSGLEIADEGGIVGSENISFPSRPETRYLSFEFPSPVVGKASSLSELSSAVWQTNHGAAGQAMEQWNKLGADVQSIANDLRAVAQSIASSNRGAVIDAAVSRINEVATHGDAFASSVPSISSALGNLLSSVPFLQMSIMQAQTAVAAVQEPAEKQALEEAYLSSLQSELQGIADRAVPSTRNLMQNVVAGTSAGGSTNTGMNQVAGNGKLSTSGLNAAGMQGGTGAGAGVAGPGEFAAINSEVTALQSIDPGSMSTHAASAGGLGTMSPGFGTGGVNLSGLNTAGLGSQAAGSGAIGAGSVGAIGAGPNFGGAAALNPTRLGTTPTGVGGVTTPIASTDRMGTAGGMGMAPVSTMGTRGGFGGLPGATAFGGTGGTTGNGGGTPGRGAMGAANYAGRGDGGATPGVAGVGRIAAGGLGGAGNVSGATGAGGRVGAAPTVAGAPGGAVAATAQSASAGRGPGAVMGGMPMAGAGAGESKKEKMRRLTTAIEGDDNVSALLGKSTPAVPGVIGAWVRG